jgi:RNA polymerase sigma factor (sigma-70 family)
MTEPDKLSQLQFMEWLSLLEPNERELILLRFVEGLTYEELATALDIPLGTVESRLFAVRKKLLRIAEAGQQYLKSGRTNHGENKKLG